MRSKLYLMVTFSNHPSTMLTCGHKRNHLLQPSFYGRLPNSYVELSSHVNIRGVTIFQYVSIRINTIYRFRLLNADTYLTLIKILANLQFVSFHKTPGWLSDNRHNSH